MILTDADIQKAIDQVFDELKCNIPALHMTLKICYKLKDNGFDISGDSIRMLQVENYLQAQVNSGALVLVKGPKGGFKRAIPPTQGKAVINDHTCPSCGNTKCSKTETSCWKCGGKL